MCGFCKYLDNSFDDDKNNPCNTCIYWGDDGYREHRNFEKATNDTETTVEQTNVLIETLYNYLSHYFNQYEEYELCRSDGKESVECTRLLLDSVEEYLKRESVV